MGKLFLILVQVRLRTEVQCTPSSARPPDHDSSVHVTETYRCILVQSASLNEGLCK